MRRALLTVLGLFLAGCCLFAPLGCSAGAIVEQAHAARTIAPIITRARSVILGVRHAELEACTTVEPPEAREPCALDGIARWTPIIATYNLVRGAWVEWLDGLDIARLTGMNDVEALDYLLPLLRLLADGWATLELALEPFEEVDLPDFPGLSLLGSTP